MINLPKSDIVEAVADLLDLGGSLESDPSSSEKTALWLRIGNRGPQESGIPIFFKFTVSIGNGVFSATVSQLKIMNNYVIMYKESARFSSLKLSVSRY